MKKTKIRILSVLLILCLALTLLVLPISTQTSPTEPTGDPQAAGDSLNGFDIGKPIYIYGEPGKTDQLPPQVGLQQATVYMKYDWTTELGVVDLSTDIFAAGEFEIQKMLAYVTPLDRDGIDFLGCEMVIDPHKLASRNTLVTVVVWNEAGQQTVLTIHVITRNMTPVYAGCAAALLAVLSAVFWLWIYRDSRPYTTGSCAITLGMQKLGEEGAPVQFEFLASSPGHYGDNRRTDLCEMIDESRCWDWNDVEEVCRLQGLDTSQIMGILRNAQNRLKKCRIKVVSEKGALGGQVAVLRFTDHAQKITALVRPDKPAHTVITVGSLSIHIQLAYLPEVELEYNASPFSDFFDGDEEDDLPDCPDGNGEEAPEPCAED